jgi:hypothetical protein
MIKEKLIIMPAFDVPDLWFPQWELRVFTGKQPKNYRIEDQGTLLSKMPLNMNGLDWEANGTVLQSGKVAHFRMYNNSGEVECQGECGEYGKPMNFSDTNLYAGANLYIDGRFHAQ